ncbi:MAG: hypothetical protein R6V58_14505 [Planctomycetota bacterium]
MNDQNEPDIFIDVGFLTRLRLLLGRPRRLFENLFRKRKVHDNLARRVGECNHCGACCRMGIRCRLLTYDEDGKSSCDAYGNRLSANCRNFPMSEKDLAERDLICTQPCGYSFGDPDEEPGAQHKGTS